MNLHDRAPDLRWQGNQRQQHKAALARVAKLGHRIARSYVEYGPLGTVDRFVMRCSCGEKSAHHTEFLRIAAEREHVRDIDTRLREVAREKRVQTSGAKTTKTAEPAKKRPARKLKSKRARIRRARANH